MTSLREINKRLSVLESVSPEPTLNDYELIKKKKEEDIIKKVDSVFDQQLQVHKVDKSNVMSIVSFVVDFVEVLCDYVPEIVSLVGGAFTGEFKLATALRLIQKIAGDIGNLVLDLSDKKLLTNIVNHEVDLKFNQQKITGVRVEEKETRVKKNSKKGCFPFRSGTRRSKKGH